MTNQEILNKASMEYISLELKLKELVKASKKTNDEKEILESLDILVQMMLMYISVSNKVVKNIELSFIKLISHSKDLIDFYNEKNLRKFTWDELKSDNIDVEEFKEFVDRCYKISTRKIDKLIIFLAGIDSVTKTNELEIIENKIKNILNLFILLDDNNPKGIVDYTLNEMLINKYKNTKSIFQTIDFKL